MNDSQNFPQVETIWCSITFIHGKTLFLKSTNFDSNVNFFDIADFVPNTLGGTQNQRN